MNIWIKNIHWFCNYLNFYNVLSLGLEAYLLELYAIFIENSANGHSGGLDIFLFCFFKRFCLLLERGKGRENERKRNIDARHILTWNQTGDLLAWVKTPTPLSHTSQGLVGWFEIVYLVSTLGEHDSTLSVIVAHIKSTGWVIKLKAAEKKIWIKRLLWKSCQY